MHPLPGADKDEKNVTISVTPTESCWCQIYDIDKNLGTAVPLLAGMGAGMDGQPEEQVNEARDMAHGRPIYIPKGKPYITRSGVSGGYLLLGVLAIGQPADAKFDMDLIPWLKEHGVSGFAIGGAAYQ